MGLIYTPPTKHTCSPGWVTRWHENDPSDYMSLHSCYVSEQVYCPPGSIWECDKCGKRWKAVPMGKHEFPGLVANRIRWQEVRLGKKARWRK
jgi:hypothetical protein